MLIDIGSLHGEKPAVPEKKLPAGSATLATNCHFRGGALIPYKNFKIGESIGAETLALKLWINHLGVILDKREYYADYVHGTILGKDVLYISGGEPKILFETDTEIPWGLEAPSIKPSLTREIDFSEEIGEELIGDRSVQSVSYVYTIVDEWGRESMPSPPSTTIEVISGEYLLVAYAAQPADTTFKYYRLTGHKLDGMPNVKKRIYRATAGTEGAEFLFIKETSETFLLDYEEVSFIDDDNSVKTKTQLIECQSDALLTEDFTPPPPNLSGIRRTHSGSIVGFVKDSRDIYFSDELYHYAFPDKYKLSMPQPVRQIEPFGDDIIVFMDTLVFVIRGVPGMMTVSAIPGIFGSQCKSGRAAVVYEAGIIFPGTDGLYVYSGGFCTCLTKEVMTPQQWRLWLTENNNSQFLFSAFFDDKFISAVENDTTGRMTVFDLKTMSISSVLFGFAIKNIYTPKTGHLGTLPDAYDGDVWVLGNGCINKMDLGSENMIATWQSGTMQFFLPVSLSAAIIMSDEDPEIIENKIHIEITTIYRGGNVSVLYDGVVDSNKYFRLPGGVTMDAIKIKIQSAKNIYALRLATSITELAGA